MATVPWTKIVDKYRGTQVFKVTLTGSDVSEWLVVHDRDDKCVAFSGTFGGGAIALEGANDPDVPEGIVLRDTFNTLISLTTAEIVQILANPYQVRVTGSGLTNVKACIKLSF